MRSGLVLALDRTGCLQTARWSVARNRSRQHSQPRVNTVAQPMRHLPLLWDAVPLMACLGHGLSGQTPGSSRSKCQCRRSERSEA